MRWLGKAGVQGLLSVLPRSESTNLFFQRRITRSLPRGAAGFLQHAEEAAKHVNRLIGLRDVELGEAHLYEFGAGWDLIGPLTGYGMGVDRQTLVDIRSNVRLDLVEHTCEQLRQHEAELESKLGVSLRLAPPAPLGSVSDLRDRFGIDYLAPRDARGTGLAASSFDLISSTFTLEHIPAADIAGILRESARLLKPEGIISCAIDMKDHYSYFDSSISVYNFLRFSRAAWWPLNPSLHFQNRLRRPDYISLFEAAGLDILEQECIEGSAEDLALISELKVANEFRDRYSVEDLAARELTLVAKRA